jgi:hypothetical protein
MIEPTETLDRAGTQAPYGDWIVDIAASTSKDVDARVEVARNEPDLGTPVRGRPARLVDPAYVPAGVADPDPDDPAAAAGIVSGILPTRRRNTISGVVTGPGTIAIAGLTLRPQLEPSPYASAGPAPGAASPAAGARRSPDASAICDESRALPGIRGAGTRSGVVVRLQGTSFASPQFARSLVDRTPTKAPPAIDPGRWGAAVVDP